MIDSYHEVISDKLYDGFNTTDRYRNKYWNLKIQKPTVHVP
jgi:hypothetical protein